MQRRGGPNAGSPAQEEAHQWAVGICTTNCRRHCGTGSEAFHRPCGQVSPRFRGQGLDARVGPISDAEVGQQLHRPQFAIAPFAAVEIGHELEQLAAGRQSEVVATLGHALLREDAGFHQFQIFEAAVRQYGNFAGRPEGDEVLIGAARFLSAHAPTVRATEQTYEIAARLHRGEALYGEEDVMS